MHVGVSLARICNGVHTKILFSFLGVYDVDISTSHNNLLNIYLVLGLLVVVTGGNGICDNATIDD